MIFLFPTNLISGTRANGSYRVCRMFKYSSIPVIVSGLTNEIIKAGMIAMERVKITLYQIGKVKSRNPSITNWPA